MKKTEHWGICYSGNFEQFTELNPVHNSGKIIVSHQGKDSVRLIRMQQHAPVYSRKIHNLTLVSGSDVSKISEFLTKEKPPYVLVMVFSEEAKSQIKEKHDAEVIVLYNGCRYLLDMLCMTYRNGWVKFGIKKLSDAVVPVKPKQMVAEKVPEPIPVKPKKVEKKDADVNVQKSSNDKKAD